MKIQFFSYFALIDFNNDVWKWNLTIEQEKRKFYKIFIDYINKIQGQIQTSL